MKLKNKHHTGFTLVELLISLVIIGMLLAAVAVALNASAINYRENEKAYQAINKARQALIRMTTQIRTANSVDNNIADEQSCEVFCGDDSRVRYYYSANGLYLYDYDTGSDYLLCDNVSSITFKKDNNTPLGDVKSVRISITISDSDGQMTQSLAAAAVVRRVLDH